MIRTSTPRPPLSADRLEQHLQQRTFGRLHELKVSVAPDGGLIVTAVAHSRFVRQLADWAITEWTASDQIQAAIAVCVPLRPVMEVEK